MIAPCAQLCDAVRFAVASSDAVADGGCLAFGERISFGVRGAWGRTLSLCVGIGLVMGVSARGPLF